jgi:hypothetical protein
MKMWLGNFNDGSLQKWTMGVEPVVKNPQWAWSSEIGVVMHAN